MVMVTFDYVSVTDLPFIGRSWLVVILSFRRLHTKRTYTSHTHVIENVPIPFMCLFTAFGGDPARVTISSQGSAASAGLHLFSEYSQGLFHQTIMEVGPVKAPVFGTLNSVISNFQT